MVCHLQNTHPHMRNVSSDARRKTVSNPACEPGEAALPISWLLENVWFIAICGKMRFHLKLVCHCVQWGKKKKNSRLADTHVRREKCEQIVQSCLLVPEEARCSNSASKHKSRQLRSKPVWFRCGPLSCRQPPPCARASLSLLIWFPSSSSTAGRLLINV